MTDQEKKNIEKLLIFLGGTTAKLLLPEQRRRNNVRFSEGRFFIQERMVPVAVIRELLLQLRHRVTARLNQYTAYLHNGIWDLGRWADETIRLIDAAHAVAAALGSGSVAEVSLFPSVKEKVEEERGYFAGFLGQITSAAAVGSIIVGSDARRAIARGELPSSRFSESGKARSSSDPLSPNRIRARAASYVRAIHITYANVEHTIAEAIGRTEAKRHRTAAESCRGCIRFSNRWIPIADMPRIGTLDCGFHCLCFIEYR